MRETCTSGSTRGGAVGLRPRFPSYSTGSFHANRFDRIAWVLESEGAKLIEQRGIDFAPADDFIQTLKAAGASEAFLKSLRAAVAPTLRSAQKRATGILPVKGHGQDGHRTSMSADLKVSATAAISSTAKPFTREQAGWRRASPALRF